MFLQWGSQLSCISSSLFSKEMYSFFSFLLLRGGGGAGYGVVRVWFLVLLAPTFLLFYYLPIVHTKMGVCFRSAPVFSPCGWMSTSVLVIFLDSRRLFLLLAFGNNQYCIREGTFLIKKCYKQTSLGGPMAETAVWWRWTEVCRRS